MKDDATECPATSYAACTSERAQYETDLAAKIAAVKTAKNEVKSAIDSANSISQKFDTDLRVVILQADVSAFSHNHSRTARTYAIFLSVLRSLLPLFLSVTCVVSQLLMESSIRSRNAIDTDPRTLIRI